MGKVVRDESKLAQPIRSLPGEGVRETRELLYSRCNERISLRLVSCFNSDVMMWQNYLCKSSLILSQTIAKFLHPRQKFFRNVVSGIKVRLLDIVIPLIPTKNIYEREKLPPWHNACKVKTPPTLFYLMSMKCQAERVKTGDKTVFRIPCYYIWYFYAR